MQASPPTWRKWSLLSTPLSTCTVQGHFHLLVFQLLCRGPPVLRPPCPQASDHSLTTSLKMSLQMQASFHVYLPTALWDIFSKSYCEFFSLFLTRALKKEKQNPPHLP